MSKKNNNTSSNKENKQKYGAAQSQRQRGPMGGGPMGMARGGEKAKNFKGAIKSLLNYIGSYKWTVLFVWLVAAVSTVFMIFGPKVLGKATDEIFNGIMAKIMGTGTVDFTRVAQILISLALLYLTSAAFSYVQGYIMTGVTMKVVYKLRNDIDAKIHKLPISFYDKVTHGEVLSRITNDVDTIAQTMTQSLSQIITSVTSLFGTVIMMLTISWKMTLAALCILPVTMLSVLVIIKRSQKYFITQQQYLGNVNGHIEEMFGSHTIVKSFNGEEDSVRQFNEYNGKLYNSAWKSNFLSGLIMPIANFISNVGYVAICVLGGYLAAKGSMTLGGIQSFIQYVRSFTQPITQVANISNVLQQTAAAAERVFEFLGETEESEDAPDAKTAGDGKTANSVMVDGSVDFRHVKFGYTDEPVIHDFNAVITHGQKIAIVGPTGAGKTTIVKLLMRFYDLNEGGIFLSGVNIHDFKRSELRSQFGMVLQDTWLYHGTIKENIRYGRLSAGDEEVFSAAVAAQADHFIRTLPGGYDMILNEEADNISQGQKQLLTIARAILADPKILILDEATSNVDTRTELLIQKAMDALMEGRTSFVIAHRLSTIRNADLILVMNNGDIIEQGRHEELLSGGGFYANLYNSQFEIEEAV